MCAPGQHLRRTASFSSVLMSKPLLHPLSLSSLCLPHFRPRPGLLPAPIQTFPRSIPCKDRMQSDPFKAEEFATHRPKPSELPAHLEYIRVPAAAPRHELCELASGHLFQMHTHPTIWLLCVPSCTYLSTRHTPTPGPLHHPSLSLDLSLSFHPSDPLPHFTRVSAQMTWPQRGPLGLPTLIPLSFVNNTYHSLTYYVFVCLFVILPLSHQNVSSRKTRR